MNGNGARNMEAIFDVKTMRVDKQRSFYTQKIGKDFVRATDKKVKSVRREYMRRCEKLDIKHTNDDGTHPFAKALQSQFHSGGVHPLVFGQFGETNEETRDLIRLCARYAAAREENADMSPISNSMRNGTTLQVVHSQFRRAIGVIATRTVAQTRLRRIAFIRSSKAEAASAARPESHNHYDDHSSQHWFRNNDSREHFGDFYAYHSQHRDYYCDL